MLKHLAALSLALTAAACAGEDYVNGGSLQSSSEVYSSQGLRIVREEVQYYFLPGLPDEVMFRWVASNDGRAGACVRVKLFNMSGDGGYNHSGVFYLAPGAGRTLVAWQQNAYGSEVRGTAQPQIWAPSGTDCVANAPA